MSLQESLPLPTMSIGVLQRDPLLELLQHHVRRYPRMRVPDVYKLLYQGEFGNKHVLEDPQAAWTLLRREMDRVEADSTEPLSEHISPDHSIIRIHLRPFKSKNLDPSGLWNAMIHAAEAVTGDVNRLRVRWQIFEKGTKQGLLPFSVEEVAAFWQAMERKGFPSVHHSQEYVESYHPAYRVIETEFLSIAIQ